MSKDASDNDKDKTVRSTREIKAGLLRRAFDGELKYTPTEMIDMIQQATRRSRTLSEEHRDTLRNIDPSQPRSVLMLNALAQHEGSDKRFVDESTRKDEGRTFVMPDHLTMQ